MVDKNLSAAAAMAGGVFLVLGLSACGPGGASTAAESATAAASETASAAPSESASDSASTTSAPTATAAPTGEVVAASEAPTPDSVVTAAPGGTPAQVVFGGGMSVDDSSGLGFLLTIKLAESGTPDGTEVQDWKPGPGTYEVSLTNSGSIAVDLTEFSVQALNADGSDATAAQSLGQAVQRSELAPGDAFTERFYLAVDPTTTTIKIDSQKLSLAGEWGPA